MVYADNILAGPPACASCFAINGTLDGFVCEQPNAEVGVAGQGHIYTLPEYWRSTDEGFGGYVYECFSATACQGFSNDSLAIDTRYGVCAEGHTGILCSQCIDNW